MEQDEAGREPDREWVTIRYLRVDEFPEDLRQRVVRPPTGSPVPCPCCRFVTLPERGHYDLCPVCWWEDDGQDDHDADTVAGGPNGGLSLTAARDNYRRYGACHPQFVGRTRQPLPEERR